jgi:transcriptional regulator with XRE-family HTH domain
MSPQALIAWRNRMKLNQSKAAEALGVSRRAWGMYERGESDIPKYIRLACAAYALGIVEYNGPE